MKKRILFLVLPTIVSVNMLLFGAPSFTPTLFGSTSVYVPYDKKEFLRTDFYSTSSLIYPEGKPTLLREKDLCNSIEEENAMEAQAFVAARRSRPQSWADPSPVGDVPLLLMALLLIGYCVCKRIHRHCAK